MHLSDCSSHSSLFLVTLFTGSSNAHCQHVKTHSARNAFCMLSMQTSTIQVYWHFVSHESDPTDVVCHYLVTS